MGLEKFSSEHTQTPSRNIGEKMKILHIGKFYSPDRGGIETAVQNLAEGLVKIGIESTVLCSNSSPHYSKEEISGVNVIRVPTFGSLFSQPLNPTLPLTLRQLAPHFDLLHFHVPNPLAEFSSFFLARETPRVATYHADVDRQKFFLPIYRPLLRHFLSRTDHIIFPTLSHVEHSTLISDLKGSKKTTIIPYGLDPKRFAMTPEIRKLSGRMKERYGDFALFVGRLVPYKGLPVLIAAMKELKRKFPKLNLVILGNGPLKAQLTSLVADSDLSRQIHFESTATDETSLMAHYHACQFLVLPSINRTEAFGMVLLEAMACGKPLISTRLDTGVREVNVDHVTGFQVNPSDSGALANAISDLTSSPDLMRRFGEAANDRFFRHFTLDSMIERYQRVYSELLECPPNPT